MIKDLNKFNESCFLAANGKLIKETPTTLNDSRIEKFVNKVFNKNLKESEDENGMVDNMDSLIITIKVPVTDTTVDAMDVAKKLFKEGKITEESISSAEYKK